MLKHCWPLRSNIHNDSQTLDMKSVRHLLEEVSAIGRCRCSLAIAIPTIAAEGGGGHTQDPVLN